MDKHDNVGFIDSIFPKCNFQNEGNFSYVKKRKIDYVVICSPSNLHFNHIKHLLLSGSKWIVENFPVIKFKDDKKILKLKKTKNSGIF